MAIGMRATYRNPANIPVTSSIALVTTNLTSPIAANERQQLRFWQPFSVGATGGVRALVAVPAGATAQVMTTTIVNNVTDAIIADVQTLAAPPVAVTNALASAGTHWLEIVLQVLNGATPGNVDLQMAQNTVDALTLTILNGGFVDVTILG